MPNVISNLFKHTDAILKKTGNKIFSGVLLEVSLHFTKVTEIGNQYSELNISKKEKYYI